MSDTITTSPAAEEPTLLDAVAEFASVFSHGDTADALAVRLSCAEVDALAGLLRAFGRGDAADLWIAGHATGYDEGDAHTPEGARESR
ncbi:hypothetical protein [Rathayibacter sp. AY1E1]|uniref:hypothetical protein n=1 Tax=Rathayibacter sp. AY1E1 TaxID=2080549 RepID=UPI000CE91E17|nr:hypothetical protein [Rathayibacter sp. AY1E1]PPH55777.1 hypothetical protein C5C67_02670 [Rathayibacter sp. AY1E1]